MKKELIEKLYKAQITCNSDDGDCSKCPYGIDNCDKQTEDMLSLLEELMHGSGLDRADIRTVADIFALRGRLESAWCVEKDELMADLLEECVNELNSVIDRLHLLDDKDGE